jgi:hypothetical protein
MGDLYIKNKKVSGTVSSASAVLCKDKSGNEHSLQKVLDNSPVNNNLLINSNFANPVNQRGVVSPVVNSNADNKFYTIDRWQMYGTGKLIINDGESITLENATPANNAKLAETSNIVLLPNTSIIKASSQDGVLTAVELDNYSTVTCSAIYVKTNSKPETAFISDKLFSKDEAGFIRVSNNAQSLLVQKCYAIGTCAIKTTKKMKTAMIEEILASFGGK